MNSVIWIVIVAEKLHSWVVLQRRMKRVNGNGHQNRISVSMKADDCFRISNLLWQIAIACVASAGLLRLAKDCRLPFGRPP
ncbi:hypothetical protein T4D_10706 [Trichinella pseudospiralis]|uniref:Uncharacterized protein n=1 Tax=Trichinella pseudospiralis TaxID=6337 RepID=A0A0V1F7N5_TRIPS|nr:hypothetical protein T4D_10706 [Trichinella pseudospiralis]